MARYRGCHFDDHARISITACSSRPSTLRRFVNLGRKSLFADVFAKRMIHTDQQNELRNTPDQWSNDTERGGTGESPTRPPSPLSPPLPRAPFKSSSKQPLAVFYEKANIPDLRFGGEIAINELSSLFFSFCDRNTFTFAKN